jgi:hypothetical protein
LVIEMPHDAGQFILFIGEHRAAIETRRIDTMMTSGRNKLLQRLPPVIADKLPNVAPCFMVIEAVE